MSSQRDAEKHSRAIIPAEKSQLCRCVRERNIRRAYRTADTICRIVRRAALSPLIAVCESVSGCGVIWLEMAEGWYMAVKKWMPLVDALYASSFGFALLVSRTEFSTVPPNRSVFPDKNFLRKFLSGNPWGLNVEASAERLTSNSRHKQSETEMGYSSLNTHIG